MKEPMMEMMELSAPWHRASFDLFLTERLPQLLSSRLPLGGYGVTLTSETTCRIDLTLGAHGEEVALQFDALPRPDAEGVFWRNEKPYVVIPIASCDELDLAEIHCAGEQLLDDIAARLGEAPDELPWDETLARLWLPLDVWIRTALERTAQALDRTNLLARKTHLRRFKIPTRERMLTPGHYGRSCPVETPEGPNIGRFLVVARGATIREGHLEIVDDTRPEFTLGLCASLIPFLEHSEPCRLTMGANMLRQWMTPSDPEPPLVGTGFGMDDRDFWSGHNLVTAFVPWGLANFEDSIALSESCAQRLTTPKPIQIGDKLGNRHGAKGVISRILPDAEMPHLPDGTCVDLLYDSMGPLFAPEFRTGARSGDGAHRSEGRDSGDCPALWRACGGGDASASEAGWPAGGRHGTADGRTTGRTAGTPRDGRRGLLGPPDPYRNTGLLRLDPCRKAVSGRENWSTMRCATQERPPTCGSISTCAPPKRRIPRLWQSASQAERRSLSLPPRRGVRN